MSTSTRLRRLLFPLAHISICGNGNYRRASGGRRQGALIHGGSVDNRRRGRSLPSCRSPQLPPEAAPVGLAVSGGFSVTVGRGGGETWPRTWRGKFEFNPGREADAVKAEVLGPAAGGGRDPVGWVWRRKGPGVGRSERGAAAWG